MYETGYMWPVGFSDELHVAAPCRASQLSHVRGRQSFKEAANDFTHCSTPAFDVNWYTYGSVGGRIPFHFSFFCTKTVGFDSL